MPGIADTFAELGDTLDVGLDVRDGYIHRVATKGRVLDIGGRNGESVSAQRLRRFGATDIIATDIISDYNPDLVDDITATRIEPESFDGVYCDAVLEHVTEYWTAIDNIHRVLRPGGEAYIYVPFCWPFHDRMDFHRFTITEVARMLGGFEECKVFVPGRGGGWGYVALSVLSYGRLHRCEWLLERLAVPLNWLLTTAVRARYRSLPSRAYTADQAAFFMTHLNYNHGFCAWVRK
jgi:SAM-dependent methyltransferase